MIALIVTLNNKQKVMKNNQSAYVFYRVLDSFR